MKVNPASVITQDDLAKAIIRYGAERATIEIDNTTGDTIVMVHRTGRHGPLARTAGVVIVDSRKRPQHDPYYQSHNNQRSSSESWENLCEWDTTPVK